MCNEDKRCVMTHPAADILVMLHVQYCVTIATLNQNKQSQLLHLGDAQITR